METLNVQDEADEADAPPPTPAARHVRAAAAWLERVAGAAAGGAPRPELQPLAALTLEQAGASGTTSARILAAASAEEGVRAGAGACSYCAGRVKGKVRARVGRGASARILAAASAEEGVRAGAGALQSPRGVKMRWRASVRATRLPRPGLLTSPELVRPMCLMLQAALEAD